MGSTSSTFPTPTPEPVVTPPPEVAGRARRWLVDPPRTGFHVVVGVFGLLLLWVGTLPGVPIIPLAGLTWLVAAGAAVWALKLTVHLVRRRRGDAPTAGRWFLLAPVGGLVVVLLLASGAAFQLRWSVSRPSFERVVAAQTEPTTAGARKQVGLYRVLGAPWVIGDAVVFHHPLGGGLFDDAGFAYLPEGVTPELDGQFESLRVERIEGPWYRWWSSW
jgi:hypothetical protein